MKSGCSASNAARALGEREGLVARLALEEVLPPHVAAFLHLDGRELVADAAEDDDVLDGLRLLEGDVRHLLERDDVAAAPGAVLREEDLRSAVVDALAERVRAEAAEDDRVRRADACAREHRDGGLGDHAHVDRDAIAGGRRPCR